MKLNLFVAAAVVVLSLLGVVSSQTLRKGTAPAASAAVQKNQLRKMTITRSGSRTPNRGPEANFTGSVSIEPLFPVNSPSRTSGGSVTFEPGARSAWHTHPLGQTLIVTAGTG